MRNILIVLDQLEQVAPDLTPHFSNLRRDVCYTAPEVMADRWLDATRVLQYYAGPDHPKFRELIAIFNDTRQESPEV